MSGYVLDDDDIAVISKFETDSSEYHAAMYDLLKTKVFDPRLKQYKSQIDAGVHPDNIQCFGLSALSMALNDRHLLGVTLLLKHGVTFNTDMIACRAVWSLIHNRHSEDYIVTKNHIEDAFANLQLLVEAGLNLDLCNEFDTADNNGKNCIAGAAFTGQERFVKYVWDHCTHSKIVTEGPQMLSQINHDIYNDLTPFILELLIGEGWDFKSIKSLTNYRFNRLCKNLNNIECTRVIERLNPDKLDTWMVLINQ